MAKELLTNSYIDHDSAGLPTLDTEVVDGKHRLVVAGGAGGGSSDGLTDEELRAAPVPVSGTFYPATQPVSGTVTAVGQALRQDTDGPTVADGQTHTLLTNQYGRLKVSAMPGVYPATTGNITTNGGTVVMNVSRVSNLMLHVVATSLVGHNVTFEGSLNSTNGTDGNWFAVQAVRSNANTVETTTGVLAATPAYGWELSVNGLNWFRVRATAHTSGTAGWVLQPGAYATEPAPAVPTHPVTQSGTWTVTANQGTLANPTVSIVNSAASTNGTVVKASAGNIYSVTASNTSASVRYLKLHNSTTVTPGTTAVALTITLPAASTMNVPFGAMGMRFGTGITLSITGAAADNDTTAIGAGEVKVLTSYV